jgi:hypothetical protein
MIKLLSVERRDWVTFRSYWHPTRGVVQTAALTAEPHILHVGGPNFGAGGPPRQKRALREWKRLMAKQKASA